MLHCPSVEGYRLKRKISHTSNIGNIDFLQPFSSVLNEGEKNDL